MTQLPDDSDLASRAPSLRILFPHLSDEQLVEAETNLDRYVEVVLRILERPELEAENAGGFDGVTSTRYDEPKRSKP
jgi:hypothetical protein